ncbi:ABC transporter substrate-binding protein [Natrialbaceae archaeon A-CW3]
MSNENAYSRRTFLKATGAGAATAAVAGCIGGGDDDGNGNGDDDGNGNGNGNGNGDVEPQEGGELNLVNSTVSSLDPIQSTDTASAIIINQVYENLVHYPNGESELENQLVEEVDLSDDLLTYTFTLKEAQYHDGSELTAEDFKYAWRRLAESPASQRASFALDPGMLGINAEFDEDDGVGPMGVVPDSLDVEADGNTLEMTLAEVEPAALDILAYDSFGAMPAGLVDDIEGYDGEYTQEEIAEDVMVGTGPFEFDVWEPGTEARVTRFDDYHDEPAYLDSVHWQIIEDDDAIWTYVNERNADIFGIPTPFYEPDNIDAEEDDQGRDVGTYGPLENEDTVNYLGVAELSTFYVAFNAIQTPRPVRQAIAYVTDHSELIEIVFKERGEEAWSFTPPGMWPGGADAYNDFVDEWPYSPNETDRDAAREVLEDAGYTEDDPFELTITTYENEAFEQFAELTRDKVAGLGIDLSIETAEFGTLISRGEDGDLGFYSLGWIWSWTDPAYGHFGFEPENTNTDLIPEQADGYYLDWQAEDSEHMQKAQDAWDTIVENPAPEDEELRGDAHIEIEEAVRDDMILLPLFHNLNERFWYDHVHVEETGPLGGHRQQFQRVWLEE